MTITITAERIPQHDLDLALDWFDGVINKGFNGTYTRNNNPTDNETTYFELSLTLYVDCMMPEIQALRKILRNYISSFECTGNTVISPQSNADAEEEPKNVAQIADIIKESEADAKSEDQQQANAEAEEQQQLNILTPQEAVAEMFNGITVNTLEEMATIVIRRLFGHNFQRQSTYDTFRHLVIVYAKAYKKPKSFNALCTMANKRISPVTIKKVNTLVSQELGVKTFMEFLKYMPEFAEEDNNESQPEEVVLAKPKKPPKRKSKTSCLPSKETQEEVFIAKWKTLDYTIKKIPTNIPIMEKVKLILECMGIKTFEKHNQDFIQRIFGNVLLHRETNLQKIFGCDNSLKRYGSLEGAELVLKRFLERFFKRDFDSTDIERFFEDLLLRFPKATTQKSISNTNILQPHNTNNKNPKQEPGVLKCFPKHEEFDRFLRSVFALKDTRKSKILKILNHMGLEKLPDSEIETIKKLCLKHLYMFNFYNPEQNYTEEEKIILERFVNNFAKTLKEDANFISLKSFITGLSKIP